MANGCRWSDDACAWAARAYRLDALQWVRASGCPRDDQVCATAAGRGHLEVLKWAVANGCPWNKAECVRRATCSRHDNVVAWLEACIGEKGMD